MGQQQLLLVVLVVIIVGVTTIIAVNVLGIRADESNRDAVRQELLTAASHAQEVWERPESFEGAARNFSNLDNSSILEGLRFIGTVESGQVMNMNGTYYIVSKGISEILLRGEPKSGGNNIETYVCYASEANTWLMNTDSPTASKPESCD
ncbi:MAG: hypothetical protein RI573_15545 [Balneolaceae bacterium]|nr:hypothetical protein [Balneolaceae bacterium]